MDDLKLKVAAKMLLIKTDKDVDTRHIRKMFGFDEHTCDRVHKIIDAITEFEDNYTILSIENNGDCISMKFGDSTLYVNLRPEFKKYTHITGDGNYIMDINDDPQLTAIKIRVDSVHM